MTGRKLSELIGRVGMYRVDTMTIMVTIRDFKQAYGNTHILIEPRHGAGFKWVRLESVTFSEDSNP